MKRILAALILLACMAFPAQALGAPEAAVLALLQTQYPGCAVAHVDQWGDSAAAALEHDGTKFLCIMERQDGQWRISVSSSTILLPDEGMPSTFFLDSDNALYWTYSGLNEVTFHFHASRAQDGLWYFCDEIMMEIIENNETSRGVFETLLDWSEEMGCLIVTERLSDEDGNLFYEKAPLYFPAAWLTGKTDLRRFDVRQLPYLMETEYPGQWPDSRYLQRAAAQLMPGSAWQGGSLSGSMLQLLMDKPDGTRVLAVLDLTDGATLVESTPLPDEAYYGVENFTTSLGIHGYCVTIGDYGTPGVTWLNGYESRAESLRFGPMVVSSYDSPKGLLHFGVQPWADIRTIDWDALPPSLADAAGAIDASGYALVDNPDPKDRLHLRETPSRDSRSLGKYYSGTPVLIHRVKGDWAEVTVIGSGWQQSGWMMKMYLDFSDSLVIDPDMMPDWQFRAGGMLYAAPDRNAEHRAVTNRSDWQVAGIIGDDWLHVWNPWTGEAGFTPADDALPGNR